MISTYHLLRVMAESPQRSDGVRRLARALGVPWVGRTREQLAGAVAQAARLDSMRGMLAAARDREGLLMRAQVTIIDTPEHVHHVVTSCHLTARGYVHVSDLTPIEAYDLGPELTGEEVLRLRSPLARIAVARRLVHDVTTRVRRRTA